MRESLNQDLVVFLRLLIRAICVICYEVSIEKVLQFAVIGSVLSSIREIAIFDGRALGRLP